MPVMLCSCPNGSDENPGFVVEMQEFVKDISAYAKGKSSDFIIIPQNGEELAFNNAEPDDGLCTPYIDAIDGVGIEELFYDNRLRVDNYRLKMLQTLKNHVKVMVADFVGNDANIADSKKRSADEGFIAFPRSKDNYDYMLIPTTGITGENASNVAVLADAKNYLYLISTEKYANKQAMINAIKATNYDVVLIDLFFDEIALSSDDIEQLKTKANGGKRLVICYVSVGSAENYRYYWKDGWKKGNPSWLKKNYEGYPDEFWVEFWHKDWRDIIFGNPDSYIDKIIAAGFDGAYLDNVEAYYTLAN